MSAARVLSSAQWRAHPLPSVSTHDKGERGNVLVVAGSAKNPGAAYLAGVAALRVGAGRLTIAASTDVLAHLGAMIPEAMLVPLRRSALLDSCVDEADSVVIGCGWEANAISARWRSSLLEATRAPTVVDAGALHAFESPVWPARCVLTPHAGEMAHLIGEERGVIESHAAKYATEFARAAGVVMLLKGPTSVVAEPDGRTWLHRGGHPGLGTSGSGDVLAGCIGGLLARGLAPSWAAAWGAHLHGAAGRHLARRIGQTGYLAREIADALCAVLPANRKASARG